MRKKLLASCLTFLFLISNSQTTLTNAETGEVHQIATPTRLPPALEFKGLFGYSYFDVSGENDPVIVNKPIYLIFNSKYCKLSIGDIVNYFPVDPSYTRILKKGDVEESFLNDETSSTPRGWYSILMVGWPG